MNSTIFYIILPLFYVAAILAISWMSGRHETREDYLIGNRRYAWWGIAIGIGMSWVNASGILSVFFLVTQDMPGFLALFASFFVVLFLFGFAAPRLRRLSTTHNAVTAPQLVEAVIGPLTAQLTSFLILCMFVAWIVLELVSAGTVLSTFTGLSYEICIVTTCTIVCFYLWIGGFRALMGTDMFQFVFLVVLGLLPFMLTGQTSDIPFTTVLDNHPVNMNTVIAGLVTGIVGTICAPEIWQRIMATKSEKDARNGLFAAAPLYFLLYAVLSFIGLALYGLTPETDPGEYLFYMSDNLLPGWMGPFLFITLLALIMSTLDTLGFVAGQSLTNDGIAKLLKTKNQHPRRFLRWGILIVFALVTILSLVFRDVLDILYFIMSYWALATPMAYVFLSKTPPSEKSMVITIATGFIAVTILQLSGLYQDYMTGLVFAFGLLAPWALEKLLKTRRAKPAQQ